MDKPKNSIPHPPSPIAVLKETTEDIKNRLRTVENDLKDSAQRITKLEERMAAGAGRYKHSQPKRRAFSSWTSLAVCIVSVFLLLLGTIRILDHLNRVADNTAATSQRSTKVSHEQSSQKEEKPSNTLKDFDERIKKNTGSIQKHCREIARLSEDSSAKTISSRPIKELGDSSFNTPDPAGAEPSPGAVHHYPANVVANSPLSLPPPTAGSRFSPLEPKFLKILENTPKQIDLLKEQTANLNKRVIGLEEWRTKIQKAFSFGKPEPVPKKPK